MLSNECSTKPGSRRSSSAAEDRSVSRLRSSNGRIGRSPASLVRGEAEISTSTGREGKKSNDNRGTDCKLMVGPRVGVQSIRLHHFIRRSGACCLANYE